MLNQNGIDEGMKKWAVPVSHDKYEVAVGIRCSECLKLFKTGKRLKKGECKCPRS
jgi:hypothetical protein